MPPRPPLLVKGRELSGEMLEPFFAPLSTELLEPGFRLDKKERALLAEYRALRAKLVAELRVAIAGAGAAPSPARLAAFSALAAAQEPELRQLETLAEMVRMRFAREINWDEFRKWRLNHGNLRQPRDQTLVLELEVVRAAAFFQVGIAPAQCRLLREAAWRMEDKIFADRRPASALFQFFSPDLMLVRFPDRLPPGVADELALHAAEKEALRQELRNAIYEMDGGSSSSRERALRRLVVEQEPRLAALEDLAEKIRRELVPLGTGLAAVAPGPVAGRACGAVSVYANSR